MSTTRKVLSVLKAGAKWGLVASTVGLGAYYITRPEDQRKMIKIGTSRYYTFWSTMLPIFAHYKYTSWYYKGMPDEVVDQKFNELHGKYAQDVLDLILKMRGLYIKMGQVAATRTDFTPKPYADKLKILFDAVPSSPGSEMRQIVCDGLGIEKIEDKFSWFNDKAIGAASISQVHEAKLLDGTDVVVKIQYPDVKYICKADFQVAKQFVRIVMPEALSAFDEIEKQLMSEFDFVREGNSLEKIYNNIMPNYSDSVVVPRPFPGLVSKDVLVMEKLHDGVKLVDGIIEQYTSIAKANGLTFDDVKDRAIKEMKEGKARKMPSAWQIWLYVQYLRTKNTVANCGIMLYNVLFGQYFGKKTYYEKIKPPINHIHLIDTLVKVHGHEIFVDGVFNADSHPGNILLLPSGKLGLIDYGQVKELNKEQRKALAKLMVCLAEENEEKVFEAMKEMGFRSEKMDPHFFYQLANFYYGKGVEGSRMHALMEEMNKRDKILEVPVHYMMAGRAAMLIRAISGMLMYKIDTSKMWLPFATKLLEEND
eukprot:TRINITY_DN7434_c0_g4_i1.p1 TRINITY_DN7434_c0_g4~~TRINITY_DN7434_c0_g4_i1.p1  ORF type:complete len:536 (+),score=101.24 TRINITY_DN7434_c0_g4_i1:108-1715(+)